MERFLKEAELILKRLLITETTPSLTSNILSWIPFRASELTWPCCSLSSRWCACMCLQSLCASGTLNIKIKKNKNDFVEMTFFLNNFKETQMPLGPWTQHHCSWVYYCLHEELHIYSPNTMESSKKSPPLMLWFICRSLLNTQSCVLNSGEEMKTDVIHEIWASIFRSFSFIIAAMAISGIQKLGGTKV